MFLPRLMIGLATSFCLSACASQNLASADSSHTKTTLEDISHHKDAHNEPTPYDKNRDAQADIDATLARAQAAEKMTIIAMGANWCHDSRGFAAQFEKERFLTLLSDHYELVYVDVGKKNRNINIAQSLGVDNIVGTPTVFILGTDGEVKNLETAPTWRNAASRTEDEIYDYFVTFIDEAED